jgi:hypothetical protein
MSSRHHTTDEQQTQSRSGNLRSRRAQQGFCLFTVLLEVGFVNEDGTGLVTTHIPRALLPMLKVYVALKRKNILMKINCAILLPSVFSVRARLW